MNSSFQAEAVIGAGRGALVAARFGAGWLGWALYPSSTLVISVSLGTGTLLCSASILALFRARKIAHSLVQLQES